MREKDKKEINVPRHKNNNLSVVGEDVNHSNKKCGKQPSPHLYNTRNDMQQRVKAQGLLSKKKKLEKKLTKIAGTLKQEELREHAKNDFYYFCKHIMGFSDMYRPLHKPLCDFVSNQDKKRKLVLIPRGHFKSTIGSICYPIWKLLNDNDERVSLASVTSTLAENNLREIISRIDYSKFQMLFANDLPASSSWPVKRAFEALIPRKGRKTGPSLFSTSVESSETGRHFSTIIIDDMVDDEKTRSRGQLERMWDWFGRQESVLDPLGEFLVIGCLTADSKVLMGNGGWKNINKITPGEEVWTFNKREKEFYAGKYEYRFPEKQKVEAMIPQGEAEVLEVKTTNRKLKSTEDHPFLVIKGKETNWVKAKDLNIGDKVVILNQVATDSCKRSLGCKKIIKYQMWFLGFMFGDGWVNHSKRRMHGFSFALGVDEELNQSAIEAAEQWFGCKGKRILSSGQYRVENAVAGKELLRLGLHGGAKGKRVPAWVFNQRPSYKREFLRGFIDADGWKEYRGYAYRVEIANEKLIEDLRLLAMTCGVRNTLPYHRTRMIQAPNSPEPVESKTWSTALNFHRRQRSGFNFSWERVEKITPAGKEEVYDLAVENNHNFIANGIVVHNTHWHHDDPYSRIRKLKGWEKMILSVYKENGDLIFPTLFTKEKLETIRKSQGDYRFSCFYLNNPTGQGVNPFSLQKCSWIDYKTTPEAWTYILVDPATTTNEWSCPSGFVIGDALQDETFVITDVSVDKYNPDDLIEQIISLAKLHNPREIIIETDSAHRTFLYWVKEKMRDKKLPFVVKGMKNPTNMNKETRTIVELQPRLHEGRILFSNDMKGRDVLLDEISTFPKGRHDDALQALAAVRMVSYPKGSRKKDKKILDRRTVIFNNMIERNGRKRSRKKRPMPKSRVWG